MKKLLTLIAALIMSDAYGEKVVYMVDGAVYEATQCEDKNNITMPTQGIPQKTGFRFIGWKEGSVYDLLSKQGTSYTPTSSSSSRPDTWTVTFPWGTVTGKARCSAVVGTMCHSDASGVSCTQNANPTTTDTTPNNGVINYSASTDKYCWCKVTDSGGLVDVSSLAWVSTRTQSDSSTCSSYCAYDCGFFLNNFVGFRRAVFGVAGS